MSGDYYSKELGSKEGEMPSIPYFDSGDGVEFSKRHNPELANRRLMVKQEAPKKWRNIIKNKVKNKELNSEMADTLDIVFIGQEGQDAVLSGIDPNVKAMIKSKTNKQVILRQMKSYSWDAYNSAFYDTEVMRQIHLEYVLSRAEKGSPNNERLLQNEPDTTRYVKQELLQTPIQEEKKGLLKRIFGR